MDDNSYIPMMLVQFLNMRHDIPRSGLLNFSNLGGGRYDLLVEVETGGQDIVQCFVNKSEGYIKYYIPGMDQQWFTNLKGEIGSL